MKKIDTLYITLLPLKVVTLDEIVHQASKIVEGSQTRAHIRKKYVKRLVETGRLEKIRRGLYTVISPVERGENYQPDKLLIASKIRKEYYLGFHTALEYYGSAYSVFNNAYIGIKRKNKFAPFRYRRFAFKPVYVNDTASEILEKSYGKNTVKVSSKERTFIDCIDRPQYAGGWEECLKSLENLSGMDFDKLTSLTLQQKTKSLPRQVGYVLELLKSKSPFYEHLSENLLEEIEREVVNPPRYLINGEKGNLNRRWKLIIPEAFEEELIGV